MKKIVTIITSALALIYLPAWAGTWKDDFSDGNLDGEKLFLVLLLSSIDGISFKED